MSVNPVFRSNAGSGKHALHASARDEIHHKQRPSARSVSTHERAALSPSVLCVGLNSQHAVQLLHSVTQQILQVTDEAVHVAFP